MTEDRYAARIRVEEFAPSIQRKISLIREALLKAGRDISEDDIMEARTHRVVAKDKDLKVLYWRETWAITPGYEDAREQAARTFKNLNNNYFKTIEVILAWGIDP